MTPFKFYLLLFFCASVRLEAQNGLVFFNGYVKNQTTGEGIQNVLVRNVTGTSSYSDKTGYFEITVQRKAVLQLFFKHPSYDLLTREIETAAKDSLRINVLLKERSNLLNGVEVFAVNKPETLVGKPNYSIFDFDFYEDKLILLTAARSLNKAQIQLSDYKGNILTKLSLPGYAGTASCFFHDYEGYTDLICSDTIFRLGLLKDEFLLMPLRRVDFERSVKPVVDSANATIYYSDQWDKYPLFNYYYINLKDTGSKYLRTVANTDLMKIYNMEYYYLPSRGQLEARRIADKYKVDKHIVAAIMSGFTQSMYYEPVYAPLFILKDTVCVFNHYTDHIYHFNLQNKLIDSVRINYHHPKNWREWKRQLYIDKFENKVYAFFSRNGHHYLKEINYQTGETVKTYKLKHHSAERIKIKDGYVYYVYRPFESTQEKFLYRERIE